MAAGGKFMVGLWFSEWYRNLAINADQSGLSCTW
jgi:hypothetical protein